MDFNHNNTITRGSSLNLMLNKEPTSTTNDNFTKNIPLHDYPMVIIPGYFKDKRVTLTDPEILFNKDKLNYRNVNLDTRLTSLQKREKKKKIVQLATDFYRINNSTYANNRGVEKGEGVFDIVKVSSRAVAEYFGIPKQSFNDHLTGKHLNSAIHGPQTKSLINDVEFKYLQNVLNVLKLQFSQRYPDKTLLISNKSLQDLINLALIKSHITQEDLSALNYMIHHQKQMQENGNNNNNNNNSDQNDQLNRHLIVLQILFKLLKEDFSDSNSYQIINNEPLFQFFDITMLEELLNQLITLLKLPSTVSSSDNNNNNNNSSSSNGGNASTSSNCDLSFPKTFSKSTLNRLRKRLGLLRQVTKSTQVDTDRSTDIETLKANDIIVSNGSVIENSNTLKRKLEIQNASELEQFTNITYMLTNMQKQLDIFSKTVTGQETVSNRQDFDSILKKMTCIITDKDLGEDTITKINNYRKLRLKLLELLKEIKGPKSMAVSLVDHIAVTSEVILKLVFENVRLKKNLRNLTQVSHNDDNSNNNNNNNLNILNNSTTLSHSSIINSDVQ